MRPLALPDGRDLLREIDRHRTPRDASAAAHASGRPELVVPGGELVGQPLPVARLRGRAHAPPVDMGEVHGETRIPRSPPLGVIAGEIRRVLDGAAETGRTGHRAVGAGQTSRRHFVPTRVLEIAGEQLGDALDVHGPAHLLDRALGAPRGRLEIDRASLLGRQHLKHVPAPLRARLDRERMPAIFQYLCQREVETRLGARAGVHGHAEAGPSRLAAVHGDQKRPLAVRPIQGVGVHEDFVLNRDRVELAGSHAQERVRRGVERLGPERESLRLSIGLPEASPRREQELLPGVRTNRVAEQSGVIAPFQPIGAAVLPVGPAFGQVRRGVDFVVDDRAVADRRPDDAVPATGERVQQMLEVVAM